MEENPRLLTEDEARDDYQRMIDQIEEELLSIISQFQADEDVQKSNAGHIAHLAERVINHPVPDTSEDRIYWHIRKQVALALSGGVFDSRYKYNDERLIAVGGYETDYVIALLADDGTPLAMKSLKPDAVPSAKEAFRNEQTVLAKLYFTFRSNYPDTLLQLFAIGDGVTVTERVDGGSNLRKEMKSVREVSTIVGWFRDICDGLEKLYAAGYERHGDVSAQNCILGTDGRVKVGDFSLASDKTYYQDGTKSIAGNAIYIAPEMVISYKTNDIKPIVDKRADMYSLGVLLYEILTKGKDPYTRDERTIQDSKNFGIEYTHALFLAAFSKTIKDSNYSLHYYIGPGRVASKELIDFFAEKYFHVRVDYPINQFGFDNETARKLDSFLAKCLGFSVENRPQSPADFYKELEGILDNYLK